MIRQPARYSPLGILLARLLFVINGGLLFYCGLIALSATLHINSPAAHVVSLGLVTLGVGLMAFGTIGD